MPPKKINAKNGDTRPSKARVARLRRHDTAEEKARAYVDMLQDEQSASTTKADKDGHRSKKRRVNGKLVNLVDGNQASDPIEIASDTDPGSKGTAGHVTQAGDSEESEMDWENVEIEQDAGEGATETDGDTSKNGDLHIVLGDHGESKKRNETAVKAKKVVTAADRRIRVEIHKAHILALMHHVHLRNHWCNDPEVHKNLKNALSRKTAAYLIDDETKSQFQRSYSLTEGLQKTIDEFAGRWQITNRGLARPHWYDISKKGTEVPVPDDLDLPMKKADFQEAATSFRGSRDLGAQIFCALLRSHGLEARLVTSMQILPFTAGSKDAPPARKEAREIITYDGDGHSDGDESSGLSSIESDASVESNSSSASVVPVVRRGNRGWSSDARRKPSMKPVGAKFKKERLIKESHFPVYWVEVLDKANQKWIPADPLVLKTINHATKFEPPLSDNRNQMHYVLAFEEDLSARDVTRRYAHAFNAKTRKLRIESQKGGESWWHHIMKLWTSHLTSDMADIEDAELNNREAAEAMPSNIQDYKDHPYYILERHVKRDEVIHPRREIGRVTTGKANAEGVKPTEPIFRRRDVVKVKSAKKWYLLGREIKIGEQPLKTLPAPKPKRKTKRELALLEERGEEDGEDDAAGTQMYAGFQTTLYHPPPVVNGKVPRNSFDNIDMFVPSMLPAGGRHIRHKETKKAAALIGVDYAEAIVGFEFRGRHGIPSLLGAVVPEESADAVLEVLATFEQQRRDKEAKQQQLAALRLWKRFIAGLRVEQRMKGLDFEGEEKSRPQSEEESDETEWDGDEEDDTPTKAGAKNVNEQQESGGGGFIPEGEDTGGGGFFGADGADDRGGFLPEDESNPREQSNEARQFQEYLKSRARRAEYHSEAKDHVPASQEDGGGGFVHDDNQDLMEGGGFMPEDEIESKDNVRAPGVKQEQATMKRAPIPLGETNPVTSQPHPLLKSLTTRDSDLLSNVSSADEEDVEPDDETGPPQPKLQETSQERTVDSDSDGDEGKESTSDESTEKGSLLSEDPDDEDADPEWLA